MLVTGSIKLMNDHPFLPASSPHLEGAAVLVVSIPTQMDGIYTSGDCFSGLRRPGRLGSQTRALVAFWKIQLFVSLLKVEQGEELKKKKGKEKKQ